MYAVIKTGGKQYRVAAGEKVEIELVDATAGAEVSFDQVLMVAKDADVRIGTPTLKGARVVAEVVAHKRGPKLFAFKKRRRKGYERLVGHRQDLSVVQIKEIKL